MVSVVAVDEPRNIGELQLLGCDIGDENGSLRIECHLCSATIYQVDEPSVRLGVGLEGVGGEVVFTSSKAPSLIEPPRRTVPASVGVMLSTKSAVRSMVVGSRLIDADTIEPVARTISLVSPLEKAGSLVSLTLGVPSLFPGSAHKVMFTLVNVVGGKLGSVPSSSGRW